MNLYIKRSLILASVAFATQLLSPTKVTAQTDSEASATEEMVPATDSLEAQLDTISYGEGFVPYISEELIEDRLGCLQNEVNLEYNRTIQSFIEFFVVRRRGLVQRILSKTDLYFPIFEEALQRHNMPAELKYLSVVESALNPKIISPAKAGGLWQFMPGTGRDFKLYQDGFIDERFDPYKSTDAACKYLKQLYNLFGDWELALASYNCGPGNVRRAIRRSGNRTGFWEIYNNLPRETRSYVPQFVALTYVLNYAEDYKLRADTIVPTIPFDTIQVNQFVSLEVLAKQLNTPLAHLELLNPHIKKNILPRHLRNYPIRIPKAQREYFASNRVAILDSLARAETTEMQVLLAGMHESSQAEYRRTKVYHTVHRGESIGRIASKYNVSVSQIKSWNRVRGNNVRSGQRLTIWKNTPVHKKKQILTPANQESVAKVDSTEGQQEAASADDTTTSKTAPTSEPRIAVQPQNTTKKVSHKVKRGESLGTIAEKYHVGLSQVKEWNQLKSNTVRLGQKLTIWVEAPVAVASTNSTKSKAQTASQAVSETQEEEASEQEAQVNAGKEAQSVNQASTYVVQKGDGLFKIAQVNHVTVEQLKEWNQLTDTNVKVGQSLILWPAGTSAPKQPVSSSVTRETESNGKSKGKSVEQKTENQQKLAAENVNRHDASPRYHVVQKGDTLWSISKQYGNVSIEKLRKLNKLRSNELKAGQKIIVNG